MNKLVSAAHFWLKMGFSSRIKPGGFCCRGSF